MLFEEELCVDRCPPLIDLLLGVVPRQVCIAAYVFEKDQAATGHHSRRTPVENG